jgi:DNA-binding LacI/PurR family transcriptional regulator
VGRITIEDVAAASGVSPTTVSHVFSGHRPVNQETQRMVRQVADALGYRPNAVAQSLRSRRTHTIMIVVPDITNTFYPELARSVQDVVSPRGYQAMFANTDAIESEERALLEVALSRRLDGIVFVGFRIAPEELAPLVEAGSSVVSVGQTRADSGVDAIRFDDEAAAMQATEFLLDRYGPSVAMIYGDEDSPPGTRRRRGFARALAAHDVAMSPDDIVATEFTRAGGVHGMRRLLDRPSPPRAVLCANDLIAFGALDVIREAGLSVPDDIAIVGHDDIDAATIVTPRLTTTRTDARELGRRAGEFVLSRMTGEYSGPGRHLVVPHEFVVRESA